MLEFISDFLGKQEIPKMNGTKADVGLACPDMMAAGRGTVKP